MITDFIFVLRWWGVLFAIGLIFFPITRLLFKNSKDSFYIFSKVIGLGLVSYVLLFLGTFHILPFSTASIFLILLLSLLLNLYLVKKRVITMPGITKIIIFEELLFLVGLTAWSFVRATEPSIHGLEKFMDFGFVNSILRTTYFPPKDIWFTPFSLNYYFFGHLITAVLTKISFLPSNITYNLMIATLFAFTVTCGFSLLYNFLSKLGEKRAFLGGILGGTLLSLGGNLHTLYAFFATYTGEHPVPPWALSFLPGLYPNSYWYPNATRFIPFTIHEFPIYSFVVSDLHGHVTDIPFVLLSIALAYTILSEKKVTKITGTAFALLLAIMYMTNVWDGIIYLLLLLSVLVVINARNLKIKSFDKKKLFGFLGIQKVKGIKKFLSQVIFEGGLITLLYAFFTLPFTLHFKPFVSGIGVLCAPSFLTNIGRLGPFLFEANHCQKSPLYQLLILYGFFYFFAISFIVFLISLKSKNQESRTRNTNIFVFLLILLSTLLIIIPEFIYAKDIYPAHYRANTVFKLVYQSFMMLSLASAYIIVSILGQKTKKLWSLFLRIFFLTLTFILLSLVFIYPYFAIKSYYADLKTYKGLDGTAYLHDLHPGDLEAITFLNKHIKGQPVILEAQGDSYTDYARISANTGLPTVLGWTVHEWLWRGTYDVPAPRIDEVKKMYEGDTATALPFIQKYNISYIIVGGLEKEKYPNLNEKKFESLGKVVFTSSNNSTKIYKLNVD